MRNPLDWMMRMNGKNKTRKPLTRGRARVPVVMQMEAQECGAASLCMLMAYYGKWVPLEQVRKDCGVSRDGAKASNVLKTARNYGFQAKAYRYEAEVLRKQGRFPCIIHWGFSHFVVLNGFRGDRVYLNDPARGNCVISYESFDRNFTGVCLMIEPGEAFEPSGRPRSMLNFARKRLKGAKSALIFVFFTTLIASLVSIISSGFSRVFLDELLSRQQPGWFVPFMIGLFVMTLIQLTASGIQAFYSLRLNGKMAVVGSSSYMWKVLRLPMEFFTQRLAGDIQLRRSTNAEIAGEMVDNLAPLILNAIMMIFYLVVMVRYSWLLALVGIASVLTQLVFSQIIARRRINITRVMLRDRGRLAAATVSGVDMIEQIKASGAENGFFERWSGLQASVNTQNMRFQKMNQYLGAVPGILSSVLNNLVLILGVWLILQGHFSPGMLFAFQGFMNAFLAPAQDLITASQKTQEMRTNMERVEDVMEYPEAISSDQTLKEERKGALNKLEGGLTMRNVTFGYSRLDPPLIENFSLELKPGERVAFVGASGCGKSTLSRLISGLYQPWSGEILFDGKPMNEIPRGVFTGSVAVVDQDIILFEDTIANNIRMWDRSIEDYEVVMAANDAQIHEDIMQRSGGYSYHIREGGRDFSGGQRQRMEIARVLAQSPTMIIMDEATSALDAKTEYEVVQAIANRGITCVVIAHRLSTIRDCEEIIVLDHGKVAERGTHGELMERRGMYYQLITSE